MAILIKKKTRVIVQGATGKFASGHIKRWLAYGTQVVGGVTPGKGGQKIEGLDVFESVLEAVDALDPDASAIFVPAPFAADAILEAIDAEIPLIVCITEGIPLRDMFRVKRALAQKPHIRLIGPNCPGIIAPGESMIGIMPIDLYRPGCVGIVSRSGTLTYEGAWQTTRLELGQSTCIGIGGDSIVGADFIEILKLFEGDPQTKAILLIGEIGGEMEEQTAIWYKAHGTKPLAAFIAGASAPEGKRMGHAGALISSGRGFARQKAKAFEEAGAVVVNNPTEMGKAICVAMERAK